MASGSMGLFLKKGDLHQVNITDGGVWIGTNIYAHILITGSVFWLPD